MSLTDGQLHSLSEDIEDRERLDLSRSEIAGAVDQAESVAWAPP